VVAEGHSGWWPEGWCWNSREQGVDLTEVVVDIVAGSAGEIEE
jgi:hypothetical protein